MQRHPLDLIQCGHVQRLFPEKPAERPDHCLPELVFRAYLALGTGEWLEEVLLLLA